MIVDSVWRNGRIWTGDDDYPEADTIAVHHGRIIAIDDVDGLSPRRTFNLGGRRVVPGFHDAHHHFAGTGVRLASVDLRPSAARTLDDVYEKIRVAASGLPDGAWLKASGYDQNHLGGHPTAEELDGILGDRPCFIEHVSAHMLVANTAAFRRAGIADLDSVPDVPGGRVVRDERGRATGLLQEAAANLIREVSAGIDDAEAQRILSLASRHAVAYGLTSITEPGVILTGRLDRGAVDMHHYLEAVARDHVRPRLTVMPFHTQLHRIEETSGEWRTLDWGIRTGLGDDRLRIGPVKIVSDGSLIGRSAAVHQCYCGEPDNHGVLQVSPEELRTVVGAYHRAGWTVATHAIGDLAIDNILDALEAVQTTKSRRRHRIEHFAIASDEQVSRAARLGVIPVPQGVFISDFGDGIFEAIGPERSAGTYRMRTLLDAGMTVPGSTDSPVSDANPIVCIHDLVNRRTASGRLFAAHERVTVGEALRAYTYGSAYAVGREESVGILRPSMLADFTTLSEDILSIGAEHIHDVGVITTVIGGEAVYERE